MIKKSVVDIKKQRSLKVTGVFKYVLIRHQSEQSVTDISFMSLFVSEPYLW